MPRRVERDDTTGAPVRTIALPAWQKPTPRYAGGGSRLYACPLCHDSGRITLSRSKDDETREELVCLTDARIHHSYICVGCRRDELWQRLLDVEADCGAPDGWAEEQIARLDIWAAVKREEMAKPRAPGALRAAVMRSWGGTQGADMVGRMDAAKRERERLRAEDAAKPKRGEGSIGDVISAD